MVSRQSSILEQLLDLLFHIAKSDGDITAPEQNYLHHVARIFGFDDNEFDRLLAIIVAVAHQRRFSVSVGL